MAFLKEKFSSLNADHPEESVALVVQSVRDAYDSIAEPIKTMSNKMQTDLKKNQTLLSKWNKGIGFKIKDESSTFISNLLGSQLYAALSEGQTLKTLKKTENGKALIRWLQEMNTQKLIQQGFESLQQVRNCLF